MADVNPGIFKAYDIRGIYPEQLDEETAYKVGRAYAQLLKEENPGKQLTIVVSGDMRVSTPQLKSRLIDGVTDSGVNVVDAGTISTPSFYFAVAFNGHDGGIQVSASHNPKQYNGFKMVRKNAVPVSGDSGIETIKDMAIANEFEEVSQKGTVEQLDNVTAKAVEEQKKEIDLTKIKPLKIVVDAANAMGAVDVEEMFKGLPIELIRLNFELDGTFPAHSADPLEEDNLDQLKEAVVEHKADMGIAPDGDGDRYFFVDEQGELVRQEILRGIMAQISLKEYPGATVAYDVRPGKITKDMIDEAGGRSIVTRVGHSLIKEQMLKEDAVFGGESSGHYFYKFSYGTFEAPTSLVLRFLVFVSEQDQPLSEIVKPYKRYFHSGEINSTVKDPKERIAAIKTHFADANLIELDGITVEYPDYWFNVRASNTEPLIRLNLEAISKEVMEQRKDEVLAFIRSKN